MARTNQSDSLLLLCENGFEVLGNQSPYTTAISTAAELCIKIITV